MPLLIVLLGNPGGQYEKTRHNCARRLEEFIPAADSLHWQVKFHGRYAMLPVHIFPQVQRHGSSGSSGPRPGVRPRERIYLLKPETYMNKSGHSVQAAASFFTVPIEDILIVHDDIEQDFGKIRIRRGGGLAGHNGLRSVAAALGSRDFSRLSIGIGRPRHGSVASFVLGRFTPEEEAELPVVLKKAAEKLMRFILTG